MLNKKITYEDFNGLTVTEEFCFHFTEAELAEMNLSHEGGMEAYINRIVNTRNTPELAAIFKELILKAVGVKSDDGKRFIKNDKVREEFASTNAYSVLYIELLSDEKAAAKFLQACMPKKIADEVQKNAALTPLNP